MVHAARVIWLILCVIHFALGIDFIVFPQFSYSRLCEDITVQLNALLGHHRVEIHENAKLEMTWFWYIQASEAQREQIMKWEGVKDVIENAPMSSNNGGIRSNVEDRGLNSSEENPGSGATQLGATRLQPDAPQDLDLVSWPPDTYLPLVGKMKGYAYDSDAGSSTFIYVIDNGINMNNAEFTDMPAGPPEWHFPRRTTANIQSDDNVHGHGSCVASKAAGKKTGVSKNSRLVIMKASNYMYEELSAFENVLDDVISKGRGGKSVVVYARSSWPKRFHPAVPLSSLPTSWQLVRTLMESIVAQQVSVVVGAGNDNRYSSAVDTLPATWLGQFPLVVVGAVTNSGNYADWTQGIVNTRDPNEATFWAPGDDIVCADGPSAPGLKHETGTSFAAPMVAGLIAYSLNLSQSPAPRDPRALLTWLWDTSRPIRKRILRPNTTPRVIWNQQVRRVYSTVNTSSSDPSLLSPQQVGTGNLTTGPISLVNQTTATAYSVDDAK